MAEELSTITTWAAAIAATLERHGQDPAPLFAAAGLDPQRLDDIDARYPVSGMTRLWRQAATVLGPQVGLEVAAQMQPGALHALGSALLASATLAESFQRLNRYSRIVSNAGHWEIESGSDTVIARLQVVEQGQVVADEAVDAFLAAAVRISRLMSVADYHPQAVSLCRAPPADPAPYHRHFGCPVRFAQAHNSLQIDAVVWQAPLRGANAAVAQATEQIAADYLARLDRALVSQRLRAELLRRLPAGEPSLTELATALALSERSLQRRLRAEGWSYQRLLDTTRQELARTYLEQSRHGLSEIAFLLGFSDQSNFNRAFRRWTGQAPGAYRAGRLGMPNQPA